MRVAVHWFRRDLRLGDNVALDAAAAAADVVVPLFVLDDRLLRAPAQGAPRVAFLLDALKSLSDDLARAGATLVVRRGAPEDEVVAVARAVGAEAVFCNEDHSPYGRRRDARVRAAAGRHGIALRSHRDLVLVDPGACLKDDGTPYTVFTPYARRWRTIVEAAPLPRRRLAALDAGLRRAADGVALPARVEDLGVGLALAADAELEPAGETRAAERLARFVDEHLLHYRSRRDYPALDATSHLSPHLKLGTISPRTVYAAAADAIGPAIAALDPAKPGRALGADAARRLHEGGVFLNELCWRDFYQAILFHFPHVARGPFQPALSKLEWPEPVPTLVAAWRDGLTGYPIVDAGMRQLARTGWMHNRLRMVVAMFLTKTLLVDYRIGERVFLERLVDADLAANNGGWQWSASTGTDAAPYFRIFNPLAQAKRYDPDGSFVRRFVPELRDVAAPLVHEPSREPLLLARTGYPPPCVDHAAARKRALALFADRARVA